MGGWLAGLAAVCCSRYQKFLGCCDSLISVETVVFEVLGLGSGTRTERPGRIWGVHPGVVGIGVIGIDIAVYVNIE